MSIAFPLAAIEKGALREAAMQRAHERDPDDDREHDRVFVATWASLVSTHRHDDPGTVHVLNAVRDVLDHEGRAYTDDDLVEITLRAQDVTEHAITTPASTTRSGVAGGESA